MAVCYSLCALNFAKFRRQLKGLKKTTTNMQVVGFTDGDTYTDVVSKGAQALGVKCATSSLVPRPHPLFNVARRKGGRPGRRKSRELRVYGMV